ncbi:MAG TPA: STAS domain-containing protein [Micromonosporaceae bacterium]
MQAPPVIALGPTVDRADIPVFCGRLAVLLRDRRDAVVQCEVGTITEPDTVTLEALARLQLTARRLGGRIQVCGAQRRLREIIAFTGLGEVLPLAQASGQAEEREQPVGVEERVEPDDPPG